MRLRYAGICARCGLALGRDAEALYDAQARTVRCVECPTPSDEGQQTAFEGGVAGASALREFDRRKAAREIKVKRQLGSFLGGVTLAITPEPQSTRAWQRGALGEQKLGRALAAVADLRVLHDRRVPGTKGNIDHLLVSRSGVFVVDAKMYTGEIRVRDRGGLFATDERLYVGRRDCSELAENMEWQVNAVRAALEASALPTMPRVTPVLCFVDGDWPLLFRRDSYRNVRLEGARSIIKLIARDPVLDVAAMHEIALLLMAKFPAK